MAITSAQVVVSTTAAALNVAGNGQNLAVKNSHATDALILGPSGVTTGNGFSLAAGATVVVEIGPSEVLYGLRGGANDITAHVLRTSA